MAPKLLALVLSVLLCGASARVYSSFWAPLFDRTVLGYRVDAPFEPSAALAARDQYTKAHGYRGERLIADFGNGRPPGDKSNIDTNQVYGDVKFYYT